MFYVCKNFLIAASYFGQHTVIYLSFGFRTADCFRTGKKSLTFEDRDLFPFVGTQSSFSDDFPPRLLCLESQVKVLLTCNPPTPSLI